MGLQTVQDETSGFEEELCIGNIGVRPASGCQLEMGLRLVSG